jgi:hypothetical protein
MGLSLNAADARKADNVSSVIRETGRYVGVITRAEKLLSKNKVEGLGLSFRSDDGASANYLDVYTVKPDGEKLRGYNIVQALLCCTRLKNVDEGEITFERWDREEGRMVQTKAAGYPALMGKRIGLLLQKELATHSVTGEDTERLNIYVVFEASTGLVSTEILDQKTKPERIEALEKFLMANPIRDTRKRTGPKPATQAQSNGNYGTGQGGNDFDDSIPF